jgi:acetyltransferase-like isoleucine patch superfamily enzyme
LPVHPSTQLGRDVKIHHADLVNLYGCRIGDETRIGAFVEIQRGAVIGARCKISSHSFICEGVTIEDGVFIGHGVIFTNDLFPKAVADGGDLVVDGEWVCHHTIVRQRASIGSGATVLPVKIGEGALVGAGAVVTRDVPDFAIVTGNPARVVGDTREKIVPRTAPVSAVPARE